MGKGWLVTWTSPQSYLAQELATSSPTARISARAVLRVTGRGFIRYSNLMAFSANQFSSKCTFMARGASSSAIAVSAKS
jgi:hypothetical protein